MSQDLEKRVEALESAFTNMSSRFRDMEAYKNPTNVLCKIDHLYEQVRKILEQMVAVNIKVESFSLDKDYNFIEEFTNEQIDKFFMHSGLTTSDVKAFMEKNIFNSKPISIQTAYKYLKGDIEDKKNRSTLGKYLRYEYHKKTGKSDK